MGNINYTPAQSRVITIRDKNVLVSAAAGSGKTAVLTARIVDRILDEKHPVSIDRLLIVTFTDAAAAEMRERIGKAIEEKIKEDPDNAFLKRQSTLVHSALIMTLHSFCLYLIRNHFDRIGIDPSFRVQSAEEGKILLSDTLDEVIAKMRENEPEEYERLLDFYDCILDDSTVRELVLKIGRVAEARPFPLDWYAHMEKVMTDYASNPEGSALADFALSYENDVLYDVLDNMEKAIEYTNEPGGPANYKTLFDKEKGFVQNLLSQKTIRERYALYNTFSFDRLPKESASDLKTLAQNLRDSWKESINNLWSSFYFLPFDREMEEDVKNTRILLTLLKISRNLYIAYDLKKRKRNVIDFSDMEHFALEILYTKDEERKVSEVALAYRDFFEEVMVDEYQDSNEIQERLLSAVAWEKEDTGNRFMVGDVKQSIYRFRQAKPQIFREKYDSYRIVDVESPEVPKEKNVRIDLSSNFRSRSEVLSAVNRVFEDSMHRSVGEIEYDKDARLYLGASYPEVEEGLNRAELIVLPNDAWRSSDIRGNINREALACGERIKELIESAHPVLTRDENGNSVLRPVRYSDIVILLRKTSGRAPKIKAVLEGMGIPTMVLSKEGYFATPEIILVMNFISVIDNPRQDIPLLGVLHSFIGGLSETDLANIKKGHKQILLYDAISLYLANGRDEALKSRLTAFLDKLSHYRLMSKRMGVYELLLRIYAKEGIYERFRALNLGEQRVANLKILLEKAQEFSGTGYTGLFTFLQYIENIRNRDIDFGEANILDENADVVRIFTMHKSKGLEFPVCFLLGMGESLTKSADKKIIMVDEELGMGTEFADPVLRIKHPSFAKNVLLLKEAKEQRGEDLRLLYVAMTRAKEKLIMIGTATNTLLDQSGSFGGNRSFTTLEILGLSNYMEMLLPVAERNPKLYECRRFLPKEEEDAKQAEQINREVFKNELLGIPAGEALTKFVYPYEVLRNVHSKTTVSDLKKAAYEEAQEASDELYPENGFVETAGFATDATAGSNEGFDADADSYIPLFMRDNRDEITGAMRGSAFHRMMELMELKEFHDEMEELSGIKITQDSDHITKEIGERLTEKVMKQIKRFAGNLSLSETDSKLIRTTNVVHFLESDMALRMEKADESGKLYREQPFVIAIPATEVYPKLLSAEQSGEELQSEKVLIQGVIDVYFEEDGELVLLDYKTDYNVDEEELIKRYLVQLKYYARALESLEGKRVKEVYIYSTCLGRAFPVMVE